MQAHDVADSFTRVGEFEFHELSRFNDGTLGIVKIAEGQGPWERHPDTDELFHLLAGRLELTVLAADGPQTLELSAGQVFVIPRGHWHRARVLAPIELLYLTPGISEHSEADDPRQDADGEGRR